ncbi:hypothetical protein Pmani_024276 [Petrolisthes manimaculis]|uniref:Uncharacterized protein n=1 Tax=Petrolisthes manimaculis TaxID=1843537 RepID=A0AAE1P954_9EUCA|nr:hypothetical protein Pmani_024276 [Petrolisthes manimaculis]
MDPAHILQLITNSTWLVTKLVGVGVGEVEGEYVVHIPENTRRQQLLRVSTKIQAQGVPVLFQIIEGNEAGHFWIHPNSGRIALITPLDYETQPQYDLVVWAGWSETRVVVKVVNVNDHAPVFPTHLYETQITEEDDRHLPKIILTQVTATDSDAGEYGRLTYSLFLVGADEGGAGVDDVLPSTLPFSIHPHTGAILVLRPLDRDPPNGRPQWRLQVRAWDGQQEASTEVWVNLKDVNDNAPYFPTHTVLTAIAEHAPQGSVVCQVQATDRDDLTEGTNALLTYSLDKNVIDEGTGTAIFTIDTQRGVITTALPGLDREKTHRYTLQVVATDGGGLKGQCVGELKGTGTVVVEVEDVNDVPPRFTRPEWSLDVSESVRPGQPIAILTVVDPDVNNDFAFRGDEGWSDKYHVDGAWVNLQLLDSNDNTPIFTHPHHHHHITLPENTPTPTLLNTFTATDRDGGVGGGRVDYMIWEHSDPLHQFGVGVAGDVWLVDGLDRETHATHTVLVLAVDRGLPPRTATATLFIEVTDVNDNPPYLSWPNEVNVRENSDPHEVARLTLGDLDDWDQGHGPPFTLRLDPMAPTHVTKAVRVILDKEGDDGRGVGLVYTRQTLDREERDILLVPIVVNDGGMPQLTTTLTFTIHITDLNDNTMLPATKDVIVHTFKNGGGAAVPLGRVYVKDPDHWHGEDKAYYMLGRTHHHFHLDTHTGYLTMEPSVEEGRYEVSVSVSDVSLGQSGVRADVRVEVRRLSEEDVNQATLLTLHTHPYRLVTQMQGGTSTLLDLLQATVSGWLAEQGDVGGVRAAWVEPPEDNNNTTPTTTPYNNAKQTHYTSNAIKVSHLTPITTTPTARLSRQTPTTTITPTARVWLVTPGINNLKHILLYRKNELNNILGVWVESVGVGVCDEGVCEGGCWRRAVQTGGFTVLDAHTSAVVGPRLQVLSGCGCESNITPTPTFVPTPARPPTLVFPQLDDTPPTPISMPPQGHTCSPYTCLNGGRCIATPTQTRCICPYGTWGPRCKMLARYFHDGGGGVGVGVGKGGGGGWAWVSPIPPCTEIHLSMEVLTQSNEAVLLYSGSNDEWEERAEWGKEEESGASQQEVKWWIEERRGSSQQGAEWWKKVNRGVWSQQVSKLGSFQQSKITTTTTTTTTSTFKTTTTTSTNTDNNTDLLLLQLHQGRPTLLLNLGAGPVTLGLNASYSLADNTWHRIDLIWKDELVEMIVDMCSGGGGGTTPTHTDTFHTPPDAHTCRGAARLSRGAVGGRVLNTGGMLQVGGFRTREERGQLLMLWSERGEDRWWVSVMNGGGVCVHLHLYPRPTDSLCLTRRSLADGLWHNLHTVRYGSAMTLAVDEGEGVLYNASVVLEGRRLLVTEGRTMVTLGAGTTNDFRYVTSPCGVPPCDVTHGSVQKCSSDFLATVNSRPWTSADHVVVCAYLLHQHHRRSTLRRGLGYVKGSSTDDHHRSSQESSPSPCHTNTNTNTTTSNLLHLRHLKPPPSLLLLTKANGHTPFTNNITKITDVDVLQLDAALVTNNSNSNSLKEQQQKKGTARQYMLATSTLYVAKQEMNDVAVEKGRGEKGGRKEKGGGGEKGREAGGEIGGGGERGGGEKGGDRGEKGGDRGEKGGDSGEKGGDRGRGEKGGGVTANSTDDLRNYAYEGEGSSPGSLSSCLENCSGGSGKFLDGFREVAHILET